MPTYYDSKGNAHVLAGEIGRGGEGTVYFCEGNTELVAKIYHEPITDEKADKLRLMAENKNERLLKVAAWVVETLHDEPNGRTVGFLMPNIKAKEIHELYSLKSRRIHFPQATWHYLVHTATNLARAFYSLHKYSHVIGDVNHGNCVVLADGTVKLIDCDSYAISNGTERFRCEVGVATHLAPELQRANLREVDRTPEHDNFALAVVIFQLLFLGRHPFSGNYLGEKDKTLEDCILEYRFAYGTNAKSKNVQQPPGTLFLNEVSPTITELFERAFDEENERPEPREWVESLVDLSNNLAQCGINPGHRFFNELLSCPWCRIESQTGLMLFPFTFSEEQNDGDRAFNIFTVEKLIDNLGNQRNLPVKLEKPISLIEPDPLPEIVESAKAHKSEQFLYIGGYFLALIFLNAIFGIVLGTFFGFVIMLILIGHFKTLNNNHQESLKQNLYEAEQKWNELEKEWTLSASPHNVFFDTKAIKEKVNDYKTFQLSTSKKLKKLEKNHRHKEFTDYLSSFHIANNEIDGVPSEEREKLADKKIWTAAEVEEKRLLYYHKVDNDLTQKLLNWRKGLESNFVYKPNSESFKEDKNKFLEENRIERRNIEKEIERSIEKLRADSVKVEHNQKLVIPQSEDLAKEISQCKSNLNVVGDSSFAMTSLILITFIVPFFASVITLSNQTQRYDYSINSSDSSSGSSFPSSSDSKINVPTKDAYPYSDEKLTEDAMNGLAVPNEDITDEDIENISFSSRRDWSNNLIRQAIWYVNNSKDYTKDSKEAKLVIARQKVYLAKKIDEWNTKAFEEFGKVLYERKLYKESLDFFITLESSNAINLYVGMNYLELKNYKAAREMLLELVRNDASTEAYYNLGLAYKGLKDFEAAEKSFEYAIQMDSNNTDAHYELGYIYFKLKDKESFDKQYAKLLDLDEEKAAELLENSYKLPPKLTKGEGDVSGTGNGAGTITTFEPRDLSN